MRRRVLFLGCTGVDKGAVAAKLNKYAQNPNEGQRAVNVNIVDFEKECLTHVDAYGGNRGGITAYLRLDLHTRANIWEQAWQWFCDEKLDALRKDENAITVLIIHGTMVDQFYGVRPAVHVDRICKMFEPDLVVTLIDNVYAMWYRTEQRAKRKVYSLYPRPKPGDLLVARTVETLIGDQIVTHPDLPSRITPHVILSVNHPIATLTNLILHEAVPVYLSFPISRPRLLTNSKNSVDPEKRLIGDELVSKINYLHKRAKDFQNANRTVAFVSPLAIDELPFRDAVAEIAVEKSRGGIRERDLERELCDFASRGKYWDTNVLWDQEPLLCSAPEAIPMEFGFARQVQYLLQTDLGWRDRRLALQARVVAVFSPAAPQYDKDNPDAPSTIARSVRTEIYEAGTFGVPVCLYQPKKFDPQEAWETWRGDPGTMGLDMIRSNINEIPDTGVIDTDIDALLEKVSKIALSKQAEEQELATLSRKPSQRDTGAASRGGEVARGEMEASQ